MAPGDRQGAATAFGTAAASCAAIATIATIRRVVSSLQTEQILSEVRRFPKVHFPQRRGSYVCCRINAIPARKQEFEQRIGRARIWLTKAKPLTTDDYAMRLLGLKYSGAAGKEVKQAAKALLALQRTDGGWGGNPHMKSDPYATGIALTSLVESGALSTREGSYRRGAAFLLSRQFPDGSWHVRSRAIKFQPYFEGGFPFGHDQWISTAATAWAVQAIALGMKTPPMTLSVR